MRDNRALGDAEWLAHRYVESEDRVRFRHILRMQHGSVPFLTDAYLGDNGLTRDLEAQMCLLDAAPEIGRAHV